MPVNPYPWLDLGLFWLTLIFMLIGLFGLVVPIFPGLIIIWLSALGYGLTAGFPPLGIAMFVLITLLTIAGMFVDNVLVGAGARKGGAGWWAIFAGWAAGLVFTLLLPPIGGVIAAPVAVFLVEFIRKNNWRHAVKATGGMLAGWGLTFVARFLMGVLMIGFWLIWAFFKA